MCQSSVRERLWCERSERGENLCDAHCLFRGESRVSFIYANILPWSSNRILHILSQHILLHRLYWLINRVLNYLSIFVSCCSLWLDVNILKRSAINKTFIFLLTILSWHQFTFARALYIHLVCADVFIFKNVRHDFQQYRVVYSCCLSDVLKWYLH